MGIARSCTTSRLPPGLPASVHRLPTAITIGPCCHRPQVPQSASRQLGGSMCFTQIEGPSHCVTRRIGPRSRSMLLCLVKGFAWHFSGLISGVLKDRDQRVLWVADKTGKVHSGEGKLL